MNLTDTAHVRAADHSLAGTRFTALCMIAAPIFLVAGAALFIGIYEGSASEQLSAFADQAGRSHAAFNFAVAGVVLAAVAIAGLASSVASMSPRLGRAGGALTLMGLFGPTFFLGISYVGIQAADLADRAGAAEVFDDTEAMPSIVNLTGPALVVGLILLAIGAARSGVLSRPRSWALGLAALAPVGFISGLIVISVVAWLGFAIALVPLGLQRLRN